MEGTAVFSHEQKPCRLDYHIICDKDWRTLSEEVQGWVGEQTVRIHLRVDANRLWWLNEDEVPAVRGCFDIDLNFSPSTNTIAIRWLKLEVGERKNITAAWLKFPNFALEPIQQSYHRLEQYRYRYESGGGQFVADLKTDDIGFVINYPDIWQAEATQGV